MESNGKPLSALVAPRQADGEFDFLLPPEVSRPVEQLAYWFLLIYLEVSSLVEFLAKELPLPHQDMVAPVKLLDFICYGNTIVYWNGLNFWWWFW